MILGSKACEDGFMYQSPGVDTEWILYQSPGVDTELDAVFMYQSPVEIAVDAVRAFLCIIKSPGGFCLAGSPGELGSSSDSN